MSTIAPTKNPAVSAPDSNIKAAVDSSQPSPANTSAVPSDATLPGTNLENNKPAQKANGNKDRKNRRERPQLPDPLPEKLVSKYAKPSQDDLKRKIDGHEKTIQECFDKLSSMRSGYDRKSKIREAGKGEFDAARKKMNAKNQELKILFEDRKTLSMEIKAIREADNAARNEATSSNANAGKGSDALIGLKTVEDVYEKIKSLEHQQQTQSVSLLEEKKIVTKISYLRHTGIDIIRGKDEAFQVEKASKKARAEKRAELEAARKELDKKIDAEKVICDGFKKEVDAIRAKQDAQMKKIDEENKNVDRDTVKETIAHHKGKVREIREAYQVELDKWYLNERIHLEQIKLQKKKRYEAAQAEREERRKKWEEEQAQYPEPDPYQKEKDMIAGLTVYLQTILGETVEKAGVVSLLPKGAAPSLKADKNSRKVATATAAGKRVGKGSLDEQFETLAFSDFMQKKSKGKGKKGRRASVAVEKVETNETLKPVSVDLLGAFTHLGVTPPNKLSEVRAALDAVKEKKAYYENDPPPPEPKSDAPEKKKKSDRKANGKSNANSVPKDMNSTGAFPGLNGTTESAAVAAEEDDGAAKPSFREIAAGSAVAPSTSSITTFPTMGEEIVQGEVEGIVETQVAAGMEMPLSS